MLMLEECRLRLFGNLVSERRAGLHGRRRGGGFAPMLMREQVALVVADHPAAAHEVVVRRRWNVSDLRTISSIDLVEDCSPHPGPRRGERDDREKSRERSQS